MLNIKKEKIKSKIKQGDNVIVIAGRDKGAKGTVRRVACSAKKGIKVLVDGVNMVKKHVKPNPNINEPGGIKEVEAFFDISNVKIFNPVTKKGSRVGYRFLDDGKKVRYFKSTGEVV